MTNQKFKTMYENLANHCLETLIELTNHETIPWNTTTTTATAWNTLPLAVKTRWKGHVHLFIQVTMEEGIIHIHLIKFPPFHSSQGQNNPYWNRFCHRIESVCVIKTFPLIIPLCNQSCFISLNRAIRVIFDPINPFTPYGDLS